MQEAGARRLERVQCTLRSRQQNRSNEDGGGEGGEEDGEGGRGQGGGSRVRWWRRRSMQSCGQSGWQGTESSKRCKKLVGLLKLRLR